MRLGKGSRDSYSRQSTTADAKATTAVRELQSPSTNRVGQSAGLEDILAIQALRRHRKSFQLGSKRQRLQRHCRRTAANLAHLCPITRARRLLERQLMKTRRMTNVPT